MERHLLHYAKGNETAEKKEIFDMIEIKEEEIEINTEINENSHLNDNENSIPFCDILLCKFLDLTTEQRPKMKKPKLQNGKKEVDIEVVINKVARKKVDIEVAALNKRKLNAERQKRFRQRLKIIKKKLPDGKEEVNIEAAALNKLKKQAEAKERCKEVDIKAAVNKRKKGAERQRRFRERRKLENNDNQRKKSSEWKRRFRERKKKENPKLFAAKRAEAQKLYRLKKKEINADEQNQ